MTRGFWSCFTKAELHDVAALYTDVLDSRYEYDSNVINHRGVAVGDVLVIRDIHLVRGYGVVETITSRPGIKEMRRCPQCRSADLSVRTRAVPAYRCNDCKHTFDQPDRVPMEVTLYAAHYGTSWFPLESPVRVLGLDSIYAGKDRQNAIRRLEPRAAEEFLLSVGGIESYFHFEVLTGGAGIAGGHRDAVVRVRRGQREFRESLFDRYGSTCAVTGQQPSDVLDAAHLYSFAERAEHHRDGGLLLRSDVHRMFDRLLLTFDPVRWESRVAPQLLDRFENLRGLDARPMAMTEAVRPDSRLLAEHHAAARTRWKELRAA